jgi:small subunit ribosomal protein S20
VAGEFSGELSVAHSLSAKKRIRQNEKRKARNRFRKLQIKEQTKVFQTALHGGDVAKAEAELRKLTQRLDRVASKHTIHKKNAARKRSRLTLRLNAMRLAKTAPAPAAKSGGRAGKTAKA